MHVVHDDTRELFKTTLKEWMREQGITPDIYPQDTSVDICDGLSRTKGAGHGWSVCTWLMQDHGLSLWFRGWRAWLNIGKWDGYKWENGKVRIYKLMNMLSGKVDHYELPTMQKDIDN